ncbi:MAG: RpiB/LacA/LacB family sugar-phosphate isomerase [Patescibacteria group bacterium]
MLFIASDHAGFQLKKALVTYIETQLNLKVKDLGPTSFAEGDDFPDYAEPVAKEVTKSPENLGILICGTGQGMCIAANKVKGIRAIIGYNITATELGKQHNNANILCLAGRVITEDHAKAIVKKFTTTTFEKEERFVRRNKKIEELEKNSV